MTGIEMIHAERERQIREEGWSTAFDNSHDRCGMGAASACYMVVGMFLMQGLSPDEVRQRVIDNWIWEEEWLEITPDPTEAYLKAGVLALAEKNRNSCQEKIALLEESCDSIVRLAGGYIDEWRFRKLVE